MKSQALDEPVVKKWPVFMSFIFPALGGLLFGYDIGATSFVVVQLESATYSGVDWYSTVADSSVWRGIITSGSVGGAFLISFLVFPLSEVLGRRGEMLIGAALYLLGGLLEAMAAWSALSETAALALLVAGRLVFGTGIGFTMHAVPIYISESMPSNVRGAFISAKEAAIVGGMVLGYAVGDGLAYTSGGWAYTYGLTVVLALVYGAGAYYLPESARFCFLNGRRAEGLAALNFIYATGVEGIVKGIDDVARSSAQPKAPPPGTPADNDRGGGYGATRDRPGANAGDANQSALAVLFGARVRPAVVAGLGVITLQQITGQPSVLYYASTIFEEAGVYVSATIAVAVFKLVCTLVSAYYVDSFGRRRLLYAGICLQAVALLVMTFYFAANMDQDWLLICAMFLYVGGYQVGFGPIAWLLISEVFPLAVRGEGMALAVQCNFFWNLLVSLTFSVELDAIGSAWTFGIFLVLCVLSLFFVKMFIPETKGRTLEEIEHMLDTKTFSPAQRFAQRNANPSYESVSLLDDSDPKPDAI